VKDVVHQMEQDVAATYEDHESKEVDVFVGQEQEQVAQEEQVAQKDEVAVA
jgi:hypothetical protein